MANPLVIVLLRVRLPDRPGALGAVASRIGAVRGDVIGFAILERGPGYAVDEITIELPDADLTTLLISEVHDVEGVEVEDLRVLDHVTAVEGCRSER